MDFESVEALTFDCYGTLVDWELGILAELRPLAEAARVGDEALLQRFAAHESRVQRAAPELRYPEVLAEVHRALARELGRPADPAAAEAFGGSVGRWPAFPDTAEALKKLQRRFRLAVISNVDRASFAATEQALGIRFDGVVTAEDTGAWKPDPRAFELAFDRLIEAGIVKGHAVHVAQSLYHDHVPARAFGLRTVFVDRRGGRAGGATPEPATPVVPDLTVPDLATLCAHAGIG